MCDKLFVLVKRSQEGNEISTLEILNKFNPLIKKYSRKLNYDGADTDLIIALIETIKSIPILKNTSLEKEECLVGYIANSLRYRYIKLSKKYSNLREKELELEEQMLCEKDNLNLEAEVITNILLDKLPTLQRIVLNAIFVEGYTASELAKALKTSRQSVNQTKNRGLKNLKKIFY